MRLLLIFSFFISLNNIYAQLGQKNIITECEVCSAADAVPADIDGDGDLDLVIYGRGYDLLFWYENEGNGVFRTKKFVINGTYLINHLAAGDIDGDGDVDIRVVWT